MASSVQRGFTFSLVVGLSASTKIKPPQREQIFEYIKSELPLLKKHVHTLEEINFFDIICITKDAKSVIKLEFSVSDSKDLENFFHLAKHPQQDKKNDLSYIFTKYFQNQEMQLKCGFPSSTKINILVGISEKEKKKLATDLEKRLAKISEESKKKDNSLRNNDNSTNSSSKSHGRYSTGSDVDLSKVKPVSSVIEQFESRGGGQTNIAMDGGEQESRIKMTFLIDVPDKEVTSVRIQSRHVQELNCEMFRNRRNIYSIDIELPVQYDPYAYYWYEIKFKDSVFFFSYTKEVVSNQFCVGEKKIHRDLVWGVDSVCSHFQDIIHSISDQYSDSELCMQIEDISKCCYMYDENKIIRSLLDSCVIHSSKYLVRFALVVGNICKKFTTAIYKQIDPTIAHEMLDALSQRKLADFPASCKDYMPDLCKHLCKIGYDDTFCILLFLSRMSSFLPEEQLLLALQGCLSSHEKFVTDDSPNCEKLAEDFCMSFYIEYLRTGSPAAKDIVDCLFRHLPLEMTLPSYGQIARHSGYNEDEIKEREEDALTAVNASIKSQVLAFANKALREKKVTSLLKIATMLGKFGLNADTSIRTTFEEGVMNCFSWHSLKETDLKEEVENFLELSGCFIDLEAQLLLLKSISESRNQAIRRLFIELNEDKFLFGAYDYLEIDVYKSWLENEIKTYHTRNEDEILFTFRTLCQILKLPIVIKRTEVKEELELVTMNSLKRYSLKEMLQHIEKIEYLCDKEPTVSYLYKEQVKVLLKKKGYTPTEVLRIFCWSNSLRVNTVTTGDIVCTITELFFEKSTKDEMLDAFVSQIPHVDFWEIIVKADGSKIQDVKNNATYKQIMSCIKRVTYLLRNGEIDISFMSKINIKDEKTKRILLLGGMQKKDIDAMQIHFNNVVQKATRDAKSVTAVLEEVQARRSDSTIPELSEILTQTKLIKEKIERGSISVKESSSVGWLWGDLGELPEICNALEPVIKSNVFWNVAEKDVLEAFGMFLETGTTPSGGLISVRYLFDGEIVNDYVQEIENTEQILWFLKTLMEEGLELFEKNWKNLESDNTMPMQSVQAMFEKAHVPGEIKTAEQYLRRHIKHTVKETLCRIWRKNEVLEKAKAMASVLAAFGYDISKDTEINSALKSFQELMQQTISEYTLQDVQIALQTIFSLADTLTDETVYIMAEIGHSSLLLEFLKEIAIEDVRNLIDAVEDISESHVQESTVSALIEVKRFLLPLLTPTNIHEKGSQWIFQTLQKQTAALGKNASSIPGKISDCSLNLHNLKSLYNNVANRGQQTKEVIKSIITKGKFAFMLCPDLDRVMFEITYKENKNRFTKQEATVSDIRSRALLLLNTERQCAESSFNQEEFRIFIESVDLCLEIRSILNDLYSSGHIRYKSFKLFLQSDELQQTKDSLKRELDEWVIYMHHARNKYYLMNFIQGCQIRVISDFLENGSGKDVTEAILKYIHPYLTIQALSETYRKEVYLFNESFVLEELGRSLHEMYANHNLFFRTMKCEDFTTKITECVHKGRVLVAQLDEKSEFVVRTVLTLYRNTTHQFPEPNQLLFCTRDTTWSEIDLLLQRCKGSYCFYGSLPLYCLANVELLQNEVQFRLVEELQNLTDISDFRLAVVCRGSKNHPFVDQLYDCVVTIQPVSDQAMESLLHTHHPNVFAYTSEVAGLGKTTNICKKSLSAGRSTVTLSISGQVRKSTLIANLNELKIQSFHTLHFDIGVVDEPVELDTFLFELVVLKYIVSGMLAFYMPTDYVCFEIGNTINNALRNNMTTVTSFKREHLLWNEFSDFICSREINSPVQVVCQYLKALEKGQLDKQELHFSGKSTLKPLSAVECKLLLKKHMDVASDISFSVVHIFLNVLSDQLKKLSCSAFFKVSRISDMIGESTVPTVRSNLVKSMVNVSMEFAARSVNACRSTQSSTLGIDLTSDISSADNLVDKIIHRVDGMIRWEESNHLIYVFHNQNIQTLSPMYRDKDKVLEHIRKLFESQMKRALPNFNTMEQVQLQNMLQRVARTNPTPLAEKQLNELSKDYALTPDNLLKMVLIMMRIQSKVPVLIMGETGCGKTSLIRYLACMCEVPFRVLNVHAGVYTTEIVSIVMQENAKCLENLKNQRWLFLDEINTSENIGLICDIICHRRCIGSILSPNLVIMGACNPYKLRTVEAIHTAGLTGKVKSDELSKLVYRVLPLPEMMVDYVWDFGSLSEKDEFKYIQRMVEGVFANGSREHALFSDLLSISQIFVREIELSTCVVSLRDVQRCKTLVPWFIKILKGKNVKKNLLDTDVKAIVLALGHCYHCRFINKSVRATYRKRLLEGFKRNNFTCLSNENDIHDIIKKEQRDILNRMDLPPGTAKNTALEENVFVILVCILNKIPIFVVGKPGCSKSLAMQVIRSNLRGKDSRDAFFKTLPQLYCVSFQGSESSTSDGIIKVFEKAENYQNSNSKDSVLSVVILDEIGLAEISRFNPLKVLHNLLEPEGRSRPNIAVVGISNWALDASKMNRAVHLSRPEMDEEELFETSISISNSFIESIQVHEGLSWSKKKKNALSQDDIEHELRLVAKAYTNYTKKLQFRNFHGLRDFYSLVKFIARKLAEEFKNLTAQKKSAVIMEGLLRNFGGLKSGRQDLFIHFNDCFQSSAQVTLTSVELIGSNIGDIMARHLMIITKGESVLGILEQNLSESGRERKEIIFGSQFEEDLTDDYNYRILSRIILCMEQGIVLVLKDLENIYGSLYDMLNQNYTRIGKKNNCRVALGPYSNPFCHVADSFRCIVLVDESKVDYADPPFLNRFEKQFLSFADVMDNEESNLVHELENWIENITKIEGKPFSKYSAMPNYNEELIVSLIMLFKRKLAQSDFSLLDECKAELLWILRPDVIVRLSRVDDFSIQQSSEQMKKRYFQLPLHQGLGNLIKYQINTEQNEQMTVVFTNSNIHTQISEELNIWRCQSEKLGAFKSEKQLSIKLQQFWNKPDMQILLVHCNAQEDDKHIMLTKSLIEKYRAEYLEKADEQHLKQEQANEQHLKLEKADEQHLKLVYLIVHLGCRDISQFNDVSSNSLLQMNYLSGWKLLLMENLERPKTSLPDFCSKSLLETIKDMLRMTDCLKEELFWAFTRIQYGVHGRDVESIKSVIDTISNSDSFLLTLGKMIWSYVQEFDNDQNDAEWFVNVACDTQALNTSAFLIDALERQIRKMIKIPLAKIVYKLEHIGAVDSYFIEDENSAERKEIWCANIRNEKIFSYNIKDKPIKDATGPECYQCDTPDIGLKLPFSRVIFESIEETKDLFTDEVMRSKLKCELETDDSLPDEIMSEIILQQESFILKRLSNILESCDMIELLISDYITDFCNLYSYTLSSVLDRDTRNEYMRWTLEQKVNLSDTDSIQLFTRIHCAGWSHNTLFGSVIQLLELCANIFVDENSNVLGQFKQAVHDNDSTVEVVSSDIQEQSPQQLNDELAEELQVQDEAGITACYGNVSETKQAIDKTILSDLEILQSDAHVYKDEEEEADNVNKLTAHEDNEIVYIEQQGYDIGTSTQDAVNIEDTDMESANTKSEVNDDGCLEECSLQVSQLGEKLYLPETNGMFQENNEEYDTSQKENEETIEDLNIDNFTQASEYEQSEIVCNSNVLKFEPETEITKSHKETMFELSGDSVQDIVSFVCTKMIPTTENLTRFAGLKNWHVTVRSVLIVAAEVSTDSVALHALRLCNDIVTELVMPYNLNLATLQNIGDSLVSGSVGSEEVFSSLLGMFQHVECANSSAHVQRTICQFLIRCLSTDSDTDITAYTYLFKAIEDRSIPEDNLQLLKSPLSFLVKQELDIDENILRDLLADSTEDGNSVTESSVFLSALDSCLHSLFIQGRIESPFVLLIVDILQETFETDDTDSSYELLLTSGKILQNSNIGLTSIAAVAYLKSAISYIADIISSNDKTNASALLTELNAVLSGLCDTPVHKSLLEYFLKGLGQNSALCTVMKHCSRLSADYPFLDDVVWTDGYLAKTLECNPLALDVPIEMLLEGEKCTAAQQTTESYKTNVIKLMDLSAKGSASGLLLLYSLAMKDFFLPRYRGMLNDMEKSHAAVLLEQFQKHQHPVEHNTLMACILGKRDFVVSAFMLGEESSFQQYMVNCILVSCFARSLSICKETKGQPSAFLKRCLLKPLQLKDCFLPGFPDRVDSISFENENFFFQEGSIFAACECNRRLLFRTQETPLTCVVCRKEIPDENKQIYGLPNKSHHIQATPGFTYKSHMIEMHVTVRKLSDVSFNTLQLLVKGCLLGSVALGISKREQVEEFVAETSSEIDVSDRLEKEIYHHWKMLKELLNMSDHDVGMFLHSLLHLGIHVLFEERNALVTAAHRDLWETKFENIISKLLDNRVHTIQYSIVSCNDIYKLPEGSIEAVIREANTLKTTDKPQHHEQLPGLFRISIKPSKRDFLCQLWPYRETYPFLTMFVKQESKLALPQHIYQILQWHMAAVVNTSYSFKRFDCLKMTVREFHNSLTDLNKRKMSKKKFENFKSSWSIVKKALDDSEGFETLLSINYDTKMSDCLILDTDCDMYKVLSFLISTQNDFIDLALQLSFTCKNLQFLLRDIDIACFKVVPVTELKKENLIDVSFDWAESLSQESNSGLGYGLGKQVHYDFCNIEKELSVDLLVRKAFISLEALPKIIFTDELYRNFVTLLADVQHSIPQKSLPTDLEVAFVKTNKDKANMTLELINYLDMILTLLKKAKYDPQKSLTEFVKERINILGQKFPSQYLPSPENRVKICHIVSLHELLEELSVDRILGSLGDAYSTDLETDMEDHFSNMPVASIRKSEHVLKAIKRFIYRCIFMCDTDPEQPLLQFLSQESFWPISIFRDGKLKLDGKEEDIKDIILPEVLVCHVVSAVLCLNESIETQKQGELRMDRVITSWKSKGENTTKGKERRKLMKKLRKS